MLLSSRSFLALVCFLGALAVSLISRCKTIGFGPVDPHAKVDNSNPYSVARIFITALLKDQPPEYKTFALRKDSYTDKATGITHVFYRQLFKGIQVLNSDISVGVKDGAVISHSDLFYRGSVPSTSLVYKRRSYAEFCDHLLENLIVYRQKFAATDHTMSGLPEILEQMNLIHRWNCEQVCTTYELVEMRSVTPGDVADPRDALLQLMVVTSPHDTVRMEILNNHDQIREIMTSRFEDHFAGEHYGSLVKMIDNVPDAVSPVKAKPVYFQLPDGDKTVLVQAWLFEVEMRDNWYDAVVSRHVPHRILSIVDRVKEASAPSAAPQHPPIAEFEQPAH